MVIFHSYVSLPEGNNIRYVNLYNIHVKIRNLTVDYRANPHHP